MGNGMSMWSFDSEQLASLKKCLIAMGVKEDEVHGFIEKRLDRGIYIKSGQVTSLYLSSKKLSGNIPSSIGELKALTHLGLSDNQLSGNIPSSIGELKALTYLGLYGNQLSGNVPSEIGELKKLEELDLHDNPQLSGMLSIYPKKYNVLNTHVLPSFKQFLSTKKILIKLGFDENKADAMFKVAPSSDITIDRNGQVTKLKLSNNQLSGNIPSEMGELKELRKLDLSKNQLSGNIPSEVGELKELTYLGLNDNQLSGKIPSGIGELKALTELYLHNNQFSGNVPSGIGELKALTELYLHNNQLSGNVPSEIRKLKALTELDLSNNQLSGDALSGIRELKVLKKLNLSHNQFSDELPSWIGELKALTSLDLSNNAQLSGLLQQSHVNIAIENTSIIKSTVAVKTKNLESWGDKMFACSHMLLGMVDFITDIIAIITLFDTDVPIAVANIVFLGVDIALGIYNSSGKPMDWFLNITQLSIVKEVILSLRFGRQTEKLMVNKKIDAICRSLPSVVLQSYSLLKDMKRYRTGSKSYNVLVASIAFGVLGSSVTLSGVHRKVGKMMSGQFFIVFVYYSSELLLRALMISIAFLSVGTYAFIVVGIDAGWRYVKVKGDISNFFLFLGSDAAVDTQQGDDWIAKQRELLGFIFDLKWIPESECSLLGLVISAMSAMILSVMHFVIVFEILVSCILPPPPFDWLLGLRWSLDGHYLTFLESLIFIIVMFTLESDTLHTLRSSGAAEHISITMLFAFLAKCMLHWRIDDMPYGVDGSSIDKTEVKSEIHKNTNNV